MDIKEYIKSQSFRGIIIGIVIAVIMLLIFQAGVFVGYRKASFAYRFGDNYYQVFDKRAPSPFGFPLHDKFRASHGAAGEVMSISLPNLVVVGPDSVEKTVLISDDTLVRKLDGEVKPEDIKTGDFLVVIGTPEENSQIRAKLIRILPPPQNEEELDRN
jgi:hypothetical protein